MKKVISYFFFLALAGPAMACDICGCGVGSYYLGILPEYNKRFIGLRYQHKTLVTHLGPSGERTPLTTDETYQTAEIWGGWNFGEKLRTLAFIPYNVNRRTAQTGSGSKEGLGDVAVMGYYKLLDNRTTVNNKLLVQSLWLGGGIKLPTGAYEPAERLLDESPNSFQLGTASADFLLNAAYDIRLMDFGLNLNATYKLNTANLYTYRYGNKLTLNSLLYCKLRVAQKLSVGPNAGLLFERSGQDLEDGRYRVDVSGGQVLSLIGGLEAAAGRFSAGANCQSPASQQLGNNRVQAGRRIMVHMSVAF
jgi:hypothetical protein